MSYPMLNIAKRVAEEAGRYLEDAFHHLDRIQIEEKGRADLVSEVDKNTEKLIVAALREKYPGHDFLGEEGGSQRAQSGDSEYLWVIDPLDGTTNFLHGLPHFAISIALVRKGKLELGLVHNPVSNETFTAVRGQGAQLNGRRLRVHQNRDSLRAIIATGFPTRTPQLLPRQYALVQSVLTEFGDIRRFGAAALDLCFVAANRLDGYFEMGIHPWDIAAGIIIAQEAGALASDFAGQSATYDLDNIVCANGYLHKQLLARIQEAS